jgi:LEA14-like dessication related protein
MALSNKKAIIVLVSVVLTALALVGGYELARRDALKSCEVSLADVRVVSIGLSSASLELELRVYNPTSFAAVLDRADYSLYANGIYLGDGKISKQEIPPGGTRTIKTPFSLSYSGALDALWSYLKTEEVTWRVNGTACYETPLGSFGIPFNHAA